jgi:hypothetical protein
LIEGATECTVSLDFATIDVTDQQSGDFREFIHDRGTGTIEWAGLLEEASTAQTAMVAAYIAKTVHYYQWRTEGSSGTGSGYPAYKAQGIITKCTVAAPKDGAQTLAFTLQLTGAISKANLS